MASPIPCTYEAIDLFCGAGGTSLGFKQAGFNLRLGVDIDVASLTTYTNNIKSKTFVSDLFKSGAEEILDKSGLMSGETTTILGCPPCQGFSSLGTMDEEDPRNGLVGKFVDVVAGVRPDFFTFENVPGVADHDKYFGSMIRRLQRRGYSLKFTVVDMRDYGVPQRRARLVCVGGRDKKAMKRFHFPEPTHHVTGAGGLRNWATVRETISDLPEIRPWESSKIPNHKVGRHGPLISERILHIPVNGGSRSDLPKRLQYGCHSRTDGFKDVLGRMNWDEPSPTITTGCFNPTKGRFLHPEQDREISMREAARLQTFPDTFIFPEATTIAARQIGNAFPPLFAGLLAERIKTASNPKGNRR